MQRYNEETLGRIAEILKVMSEPMRLKILQTLHDGEHSVSDILKATGGQQANVSKHLGILRRMRLVTCRKDGLNVYYQLSDDSIFAICESICDYLKRKIQQDQQMLTELGGE